MQFYTKTIIGTIFLFLLQFWFYFTYYLLLLLIFQLRNSVLDFGWIALICLICFDAVWLSPICYVSSNFCCSHFRTLITLSHHLLSVFLCLFLFPSSVFHFAVTFIIPSFSYSLCWKYFYVLYIYFYTQYLPSAFLPVSHGNFDPWCVFVFSCLCWFFQCLSTFLPKLLNNSTSFPVMQRFSAADDSVCIRLISDLCVCIVVLCFLAVSLILKYYLYLWL